MTKISLSFSNPNSTNSLYLESKKLLNVPFDRKQELEDKSERMNELRDILHKEAQNKGSNKQRTYYFSMAQTKAIQPPEQSETPKPKAIEQQNNKPDVSDGAMINT